MVQLVVETQFKKAQSLILQTTFTTIVVEIVERELANEFFAE